MNKVQAKNGDHDGLVDIGRTIEGVEVSILLREADGFFKGSLRSNEYVNVSDVCMMFGGGGHMRAARMLNSSTTFRSKRKVNS